MTQGSDRGISPSPHYYELQGRAAEIARALGSPAGGAEHLFLGMLHDGGWPVTEISGLVNLAAAEAAVLALIARPDYAPPRAPAVLVRPGYVQPWGADVAFELGDSHLGAEHALLAMLGQPDCVPARALATLADVAELAAAVRQAMSRPPAGPPEDAVFLPDGQHMDAPLRRAIVRALPAGTTFGFSAGSDEPTWMEVIGPDGTADRERSRAVLNAALASLDRPELDA